MMIRMTIVIRMIRKKKIVIMLRMVVRLMRITKILRLLRGALPKKQEDMVSSP